MHSNALYSFIIAIVLCTSMQGMNRLEWLPIQKGFGTIKAYGDLYRHNNVYPIIDPVILEYKGYELTVDPSLVEPFSPIKARISPSWNNHEPIPRYRFDTKHDNYSHKHISQLLQFCKKPEDPDHTIAIDDIDPLLILAEELMVPENLKSDLHSYTLTTLNKTLATEETCATDKQKAIEIYCVMIQAQDTETIKDIADKAHTEGAIVGIYDTMYSDSAWHKALIENKPNGPAFNAWRTEDHAKQLFDAFVQHKKSIKTLLEQHGIDIKQSDQLEYWKQKDKREKTRTDKKALKYISDVITKYPSLCESIHDAYLLPKEWLYSHGFITGLSSTHIKFSHFPLIGYYDGYQDFYYPYASNLLITPIDWRNILSIDRYTNKLMKLPQDYPLTIPEPYKAFYRQKIKNDLKVVKRVKQQNQQVHTRIEQFLDRLIIQTLKPTIPNTALIINACALGLIATTVYATYKFRQRCPLLQTMLAHNFLQTHVTTATRPTYQFLYTIGSNQYSPDCKQILDNALLTHHMVGPITLDQGTVLHYNQILLELHSTSASLESYKSASGVIGYFGFPLLFEAITSLSFGTSIVQRTAAGITYLYKRLFSATNTQTKEPIS